MSEVTRSQCKIVGEGDPSDDSPFLARYVDRFHVDRVQQAWGGRHFLKGKSPGPNDIVMMSNDYLCMANDPSIIEAEVTCLKEIGHGTPQSRVFTRSSESSHRTFEKRMASILGTEDAAVCQSGYDANLGVIEAFVPSDANVYIDNLAHASLWKGCKSVGASPIRIRHNDLAHLEKKISRTGPGFIVVDAVYSTHGHMSPLADIVEVANRHSCVLIVDETHSFGVIGPSSLTAKLGLQRDVQFQVVGLSKAFACRGGVVAGSQRNLEAFACRSFPAIFSTQVMTHEVAGFNAALTAIVNADQQRAHLWNLHSQFRSGLLKLGYNVEASKAPIIAIECGIEETALAFRDFIEAHGLFGSPYTWPATPRKNSLIRFTLNCGLTKNRVDRALQILADARSVLRPSRRLGLV